MSNNEFEVKLQQRSVIRFLFLRGMKPKEIQGELVAAYGNPPVPLTTIYYWVKKFGNGETSVCDYERSGRPRIFGLLEQIKSLMVEDPYVSAREMSVSCGVDKNTVVRVLREDLDMQKVNFRWIPHTLTDELKATRVRIGCEMLNILESSRKWWDIYTGDETWVYLNNPRKSMWIQNGVKPPTRVKRGISASKVMVSVIWSINGIKSITVLPQGEKFTRQFFINKVLGDLVSFFENHRPRRLGSGIVLHLDNATPHLADKQMSDLGITRMTHPPYSPDLAPSDFFLFGFLKTSLEGQNFTSPEELLESVRGILQSIPREMLLGAYSEWVNRLKKCIESGGEYVE